jgi:hypothetical protein
MRKAVRAAAGSDADRRHLPGLSGLVDPEQRHDDGLQRPGEQPYAERGIALQAGSKGEAGIVGDDAEALGIGDMRTANGACGQEVAQFGRR